MIATLFQRSPAVCSLPPDDLADRQQSRQPNSVLQLVTSFPGGADNAFTFIGTTATANGIWYKQDAAAKVTHIYADTDGKSGTADLQIDVSGLIAFSSYRFIL